MTANLVNGLGSSQSLIPQVAATTNNSSKSDFSQVLSSSTAKEAERTQPNVAKNENKSEKPQTAKEDAKATDNKDVKTDNAKPEKTEEAPKEVKNDSVDETSSKEEVITDEEMEQVAEVVATMIQTVADVLDVPVSQVEEAIETLDIDGVNLLDSSNIPAVVVEVTGATDTMAIMTDEELFADVKEIMETSNKLIEELSNELDVPVEDLKTQLADKLEEIKTAPVEKEENPLNNMETELTPVETEATKSEAEANTGSNTSGRRESNQTQMTFGQTVIDTIRNSVEDIQTEMPLEYTTTSMDEIIEQVTESLKMTMKEEVTEMEMQLHPASLGNVKIQVAARDGVITANFTTQNEQVKQALETQVVALKEQMQEQGIKVEAVEVTVNAHAFERNFNDQNDQSNNQGETEAKRKRVRGINLSDLNMDELDEIDEEDRVTADMMARQGNTVDYLA